MLTTTAVIIGAGQCGLSMSWHLSRHGIDHVILERGEVADSWHTQRWDSLRLLTPNWQSRLPGYAYAGLDPDGYMSMRETGVYLRRFAEQFSAPVRTGTRVTRVRQNGTGYEVCTDQATWRCRSVVIASGAFGIPVLPAVSAGLSSDILSLTALQYRNPGLLPPGGVMVVGASASGIQIAREVVSSGRRTLLAVGDHVRLPRTYRGRDIQWWMDATGAMDLRFDEVPDINRARSLPSPQLIGTDDQITVDINSLSRMGVEVAGRVVGLSGRVVQFSGSLANYCALADLKMSRLLASIDEWIETAKHSEEFPAPEPFEATHIQSDHRLSVDLSAENIRTVIWATGYRPDYSWLDVPVFDAKGRLRHDGGVVQASGLYVLGLPFMRRRKSSFIDGAASDSADLSEHLLQRLARAA